MRNRRMVLPTIRVSMLGDFSISINGNTISHFKGSTKRVWILIQYLLAHRRETVSIDVLVSDLWNGKLCGDPRNALKNLVYRARSQLKQLSGNERLQFIEFSDETYRWNNRYECEIDSELFQEAFFLGEDQNAAPERRVECYRHAAELYKGMFLEKSAVDGWIVRKAGEYSELYRRCIENLCGILFSMQRYGEAEAVCRKGLQCQPYEMLFHRLLLQACVGDGRRSEALENYNAARELFARRFHVDISGALQPFYKNLVSEGCGEMNSDRILQDLREPEEPFGAFFCEYDLFRAVCCEQRRLARRMGTQTFLLLFTLCPGRGEEESPESAASLGHASDRLRETLIFTLRASDAVTAYSAVQFLVLLPAVSYEDAVGVADRIGKKCRTFCRGKTEIKTEIELFL